jgi:hypothetical protein
MNKVNHTLVLTVLLLFVAPAGWSGDRSPAWAGNRTWPTLTPGYPVPETQTEGHTCGFHALSVVYKAHGLNPELWRLRERLGTDRMALPLDQTSTGTLQPDMLRVLSQDYFTVQALSGYSEENIQLLSNHFDQGLLAVALIKRRESGNLHWVVVAGIDAQQQTLHIVDSLPRNEEFSYPEPVQDFLSHVVLQVFLIEPSPRGTAVPSLLTLHMRGWKMMGESMGIPLIPFILAVWLAGSGMWSLGLLFPSKSKWTKKYVQLLICCLCGVLGGMFTWGLTAYVLPGGFFWIPLGALLVSFAGCYRFKCGESWRKGFMLAVAGLIKATLIFVVAGSILFLAFFLLNA